MSSSAEFGFIQIWKIHGLVVLAHGRNGFIFTIFGLALASKEILVCAHSVGLLIKPVEKPQQKPSQRGYK
jgi:hypothetical protein